MSTHGWSSRLAESIKKVSLLKYVGQKNITSALYLVFSGAFIIVFFNIHPSVNLSILRDSSGNFQTIQLKLDTDSTEKNSKNNKNEVHSSTPGEQNITAARQLLMSFGPQTPKYISELRNKYAFDRKTYHYACANGHKFFARYSPSGAVTYIEPCDCSEKSYSPANGAPTIYEWLIGQNIVKP